VFVVGLWWWWRERRSFVSAMGGVPLNKASVVVNGTGVRMSRKSTDPLVRLEGALFFFCCWVGGGGSMGGVERGDMGRCRS
jgi:hypothetical protein